MESLFTAAYLSTVIILGIILLCKARANKQLLLFGIMALLLGFGDAFHLVPRAYALFTTGLEQHAASTGIGKLVSSITLTIFYVLAYHVWKIRYKVERKHWITALIYALAASRIVLCLFPQNMWLSPDAPISWGIYRNLPFAAMGAAVITLYYRAAKSEGPLRYLWLAVALSFAMYIPVVLFSDVFALIGVLMIPKSIAYVWIVVMFYRESKSMKANMLDNAA